jgi:hypothetical protein
MWSIRTRRSIATGSGSRSSTGNYTPRCNGNGISRACWRSVMLYHDEACAGLGRPVTRIASFPDTCGRDDRSDVLKSSWNGARNRSGPRSSARPMTAARHTSVSAARADSTRSSRMSPRTTRQERSQCHLRPLRSPTSRTGHFEGSRGGRLTSRRYAHQERSG